MREHTRARRDARASQSVSLSARLTLTLARARCHAAPTRSENTLLFTCHREAKIMGKMASKAFGLGLATIAGLMIFGCSSSSSSNNPTDGGGTSSGADACTSVAQADVQALLASPITQVQDNSATYACNYVTAAAPLQITWDPNDSSLTTYNNGSLGAAQDHQITGIGDEAYWNETVPGGSIPALNAHKGNITVVIQPSGDNAAASTCKSTVTNQSAGTFTVADSDALAFVQLMGKVANDYFAAL
jgi:hypothetical protein